MTKNYNTATAKRGKQSTHGSKQYTSDISKRCFNFKKEEANQVGQGNPDYISITSSTQLTRAIPRKCFFGLVKAKAIYKMRRHT